MLPGINWNTMRICPDFSYKVFISLEDCRGMKEVSGANENVFSYTHVMQVCKAGDVPLSKLLYDTVIVH